MRFVDRILYRVDLVGMTCGRWLLIYDYGGPKRAAGARGRRDRRGISIGKQRTSRPGRFSSRK